MVRVFCSRRGTGKSKNLINLANNNLLKAKGDSVYVDSDKKAMHVLDSSIRLITTEDLNLHYYDNIYGFICGLISQNYDLENIYIDSVFDILPNDLNHMGELLRKVEMLTTKFNINVYINVNADDCTKAEELFKEYVA